MICEGELDDDEAVDYPPGSAHLWCADDAAAYWEYNEQTDVQ